MARIKVSRRVAALTTFGTAAAVVVAGAAISAGAATSTSTTTTSTTAPAEGSVVQLVNDNTKYCLQPKDGSTAVGTPLVSATCDSTKAAQQWTVLLSGTERGFQNKATGKCLSVTDSTAGSSVVQRACAREEAQFAAVKLVTTSFVVANDLSELCLADTGSKSAAAGAVAAQITCDTSRSVDRWTFPVVSAGTSTTTSTTTSASASSTTSASASTSTSTTTSKTTTSTSTTTAASSSVGLSSGDIWVSTSGSDSAAGTKAAPYATIAQALKKVAAGQTIVLRGGTYYPTAKLNVATSGTSAKRITIGSYTGEHAVIDGSKISADDWTWNQTASYWTVQDLEVKNALNHPVVCTSCTGVIYQRLSVHDNQETGIALRGDDTVDNQILDNDLYANHDDATKGQNADGIAIKFGTGTGNVVKGNRMYNNADDGIDLWHFLSPVTIESNWAYGNGVNRWDVEDWEGNGNGFKLGGDNLSANHVVKNNAAWNNNSNGFTENSNTGSLTLTRNTAYNNKGAGFYFKISTSKLTGNVSVANASTATIGSGVTVSSNSWQSGTWTASSFTSTSSTVAEGSRDADGTLPTVTFLVPKTSGTQGSTMTE